MEGKIEGEREKERRNVMEAILSRIGARG